jgi:hypothetical protein
VFVIVDLLIVPTTGESNITMYAVEFHAKISNGIIKIPKEYKDHFQDNVKVILLTEERQPQPADMIEQLVTNPLNIPDFKPLSREELYERG